MAKDLKTYFNYWFLVGFLLLIFLWVFLVTFVVHVLFSVCCNFAVPILVQGFLHFYSFWFTSSTFLFVYPNNIWKVIAIVCFCYLLMLWYLFSGPREGKKIIYKEKGGWGWGGRFTSYLVNSNTWIYKRFFGGN